MRRSSDDDSNITDHYRDATRVNTQNYRKREKTVFDFERQRHHQAHSMELKRGPAHQEEERREQSTADDKFKTNFLAR